MDFHFHLTDEEATKLWGRLQHLQDEIKGMAGNDDKATVNAWWILHRLREIDTQTVWMAKQEDLESLFPEADLDKSDSTFWEHVKKIESENAILDND